MHAPPLQKEHPMGPETPDPPTYLSAMQYVQPGCTGAGASSRKIPPRGYNPGSRTRLVQAGQAKLEEQERSKREKESPA